MEEKLTNEQLSTICMMMRTVEVLRTNEHNFSDNIQIKEAYTKVSGELNKLMDMLSDAQRNEVLEEHQRQLKEMANK